MRSVTGSLLPLPSYYALLTCIILLGACSADVEEVQQLVQTQCAGCHLFPEPALLDRDTWVNSTLPIMGYRLGHYNAGERDSLIEPFVQQRLNPDAIFPQQALVTQDQWQTITQYFADKAPSSLATNKSPKAEVGLPGFAVKHATVSFSPPLTTMVQIEQAFQAFYVGNYGSNNTLVLLDHQGQIMFQFEFEGAPVATRVQGSRLFVLVIGLGPEPSIGSNGAIYVIDNPQEGPKLLLGNLQRPVDFELVDFNDDERLDILVCEYGHYTGALTWYENKGSDSFTQHVLLSAPGAIDASIHDFNGDGIKDIGVLMAQGDEGFDVWLNRGGGIFDRQRKLRFPPSYGSTAFQLVDFNGDGLKDLIYTNGDNADSSPIPKPYHGIRIYLAETDQRFIETQFLPLNGAFDARAADFDGDGDLDIAAISYFPDYQSRPEEGFVLYLNQEQNQGDLTFKKYTFEASTIGRWITMDTGDIDGDTDIDILLGSNIGFGPGDDRQDLFELWQQQERSYVILENQAID